MRVSMVVLAALCVGFLSLWMLGGTAAQQEEDPLESLGMAVTGGAAPGYVEDRACALCHRSIHDSYQEVGMARSFSRPRRETAIEDFQNSTFYHAPSKRHYEMLWRGGDLVFRRYQLDTEGEPINVIERQVDWILGSGHTSRTYLFRSKLGELYQLPLAWYSQTSSWGMAPGFDRPFHFGIQRRVRRECMFCHNAYPDVAEGSDGPLSPQVFPEQLPEGTGCQRCHGPGAEHARKALSGQGTEEIRQAIVNPARLPDQRRDDVCFECHMQPSVALPGIRRFDRGDYSFRPGQRLSDYLVQLDIDEAGRTRDQRFEINHHPYRLQQSACYLESEGKLSCLTCHDPHRKVPQEQRASHYREACLSCHKADPLADAHAGLQTSPGAGQPSAKDPIDDPHQAQPGHAGTQEQQAGEWTVTEMDCVGCHMPRRRTQDVIQVVMTDHKIQRRPASREERLAALKESDPDIVDIDLLHPDSGPQGALGEIYLMTALSKAVASTSGKVLERLENLLVAAHPPSVVPYLEVAQGQLHQRRFEEARTTLSRVLESEPANAAALRLKGVLEARQGQSEKALEFFRRSLEKDPSDCPTRHNIGRMLSALGRSEEAARQMRETTGKCPTFVLSWLHLGRALRKSGDLDGAIEAFRRGLQVEPSIPRLYVALSQALAAKGDRDEALRYLRHGIQVTPNPGPLQEALSELRRQEE